jgi:hypothetical protein
MHDANNLNRNSKFRGGLASTSGDQTSRRLGSAMLRAGAFDNVFDMRLTSFTTGEGVHALVELCPQPTKVINVKQQLLADFVLGRGGKAFHLRNRILKYAAQMR